MIRKSIHLLQRNNLLKQWSRIAFHTSTVSSMRDKRSLEIQKEIAVKQAGLFEEYEKKYKKDRKSFDGAIKVYLKREGVHRRGSVEFVYAAMRKMKEYGVHRDIEAYKVLLNVFPQGKMVAQSIWQVEMQHYPKHQDCCIDVLNQMEENGITPDDEVGCIVYAVFGKDTHAMRKYQRMMYWMPKFKHINPWPLPKDLPIDPTEVARLALKRMSRDREHRISVYWTNDLQDEHELVHDDTYIVSSQAPTQKQLLHNHHIDKPLYVEGGYHVWCKEKMLTYFILSAEADKSVFEKFEEHRNKINDEEKLFEFKNIFESEEPDHCLVLPPSVHEQDGGTVLALCITGTGSKDSLKSWIRFLQKTNPRLRDIQVVFRLRTPEGGLVPFSMESEDVVPVKDKPKFDEIISKYKQEAK